MLSGELVALRAPADADMAILHRELYEDLSIYTRTFGRPWIPLPEGSSQSPYSMPTADSDGTSTVFSVVTIADAALVGDALLWGIDTHNRVANIGISLLPAFHGRGLGTDVLRVLCHYAFVVRGLHRLQLDTLAGNIAMRRAAERAGFSFEGTRRQAGWVLGEFLDEVVYGKLATD